MSPRKATELTDLVKKLRAIRRQHEQALAEIETTFRSLGISHLLTDSGRKRGAAAGGAGETAVAKRGKAKRAVRGAAKASTPAKKKRRAKTTAVAKKTTRGVKRRAGATKAARPVGRPKGSKNKVRKEGKTTPKAGKAAKAARRTRGKYTQTGDEFILAFLAKRGNATTTEIRQHWQKQGRKGKAENNLTGLVKSGKLLRSKSPGEAGSTYTLPSANSAAPSW